MRFRFARRRHSARLNSPPLRYFAYTQTLCLTLFALIAGFIQAYTRRTKVYIVFCGPRPRELLTQASFAVATRYWSLYPADRSGNVRIFVLSGPLSTSLTVLVFSV